LVVTTWDSATP